MKSTHRRPENDAKVDTKSVKEIVEPAQTVRSEASVEAALEKMRAQGSESSAVTDQGGKLLGRVSKNQMNRKVGGLGHDPHTFPVEPQVDKDAACCSEDQTIGEAEKVMLAAKVDEVPVVTQDKLLVGKVTLGAIAQKKHAAKGARLRSGRLKRGKLKSKIRSQRRRY
jgi:CBS domain-containing protein